MSDNGIGRDVLAESDCVLTREVNDRYGPFCGEWPVSNVNLRSMNPLTAIAALGVLGASSLVALSPAGAQSAALPDGPGKAVVEQSCTNCHGADLITAQRRSPDEWSEVVNRMLANGAELTEEQNSAVMTYLGTYLGKQSGAASASAIGSKAIPASR